MSSSVGGGGMDGGGGSSSSSIGLTTTIADYFFGSDILEVQIVDCYIFILYGIIRI